LEQHYFLIGALLLGFFSAPHCIGMCGGIAGALALGSPGAPDSSSRWVGLINQNLGRLTAYVLLGAVAGQVGFSLMEVAPVLTLVFRVLAGALMVAMGLYIGGWWTGLKRLENAGFMVWQALLRRFPSLALSPGRRFPSGVLWGFLPCGLVYTMLTSAMARGSAADGALLMLCFGLGTFPTLLGAGFLAGQIAAFRQFRRVRSGMGGMVIVFGLWTGLPVVWSFFRM
jgi:hypothetical protein